MASKKSITNMIAAKMLYMDERITSYRPAPGYMILDPVEDDYVVDYISHDRESGSWECEYTNGIVERRIGESKPVFRVFKQV